ncbi:hypothetical protein [Robertmurraya massiliosenegalensis]|uniref:hypothetical protein n=1 Tax=Robertmurraya massiliosenegalensis TaxID=1287657 RepID=UPI00031E7766|nr:hypothetical protein [Robertmurraya massiliosenegalensis]
MKQIHFMKWKLEVDIDKTKEIYGGEMELCHCLYCQNYMDACKHIDRELLGLFDMLGIDPAKPSHLSEFGEVEKGQRLYIGSYHLVARLMEGEYCTDSDWNKLNTAEMRNFTFAFEKELMFVPNGFPEPVVQLGFEARIPWVLREIPTD